MAEVDAFDELLEVLAGEVFVKSTAAVEYIKELASAGQIRNNVQSEPNESAIRTAEGEENANANGMTDTYLEAEERSSRWLTMLRWLITFIMASSRRALGGTQLSCRKDLSIIFNAYSNPVFRCWARCTLRTVP